VLFLELYHIKVYVSYIKLQFASVKRCEYIVHLELARTYKSELINYLQRWQIMLMPEFYLLKSTV